MIGISKYRIQGLREPLMVNVMHGLGLESVPFYDNENPAKTESKVQIQEFARRRHGPVAEEREPVNDPAVMAERIKGMARDLGADLVGIARLRPVMINIGVDLPYEWVICLALREDYHAVLDGPAAVEEQAFTAYYHCARTSTELAERIRAMGWPALPHHNGGCDIMAIPAMYQAGFGELGKHGSLINPSLGADFRPGFVTTNLPLVEDGPLTFGVPDYCENCNLCINNCPGDAMAREPILTEGIRRWLVNTEKCYPYSRFREEYCHICVDVCPYIHKENGNQDLRGVYKAYMKTRKNAGWRTPKGAAAE